MTTRRGFLAGILAAGFAPAAIGSGVLMPVRKIAGLYEDTPLRPWMLGWNDGIVAQRQFDQEALNRIRRQLMDNAFIANANRASQEAKWALDEGWYSGHNPGDTLIYRVWSADKDAPGGLSARDERLTLSEAQARGLPEPGFTRVPGYRRYIS